MDNNQEQEPVEYLRQLSVVVTEQSHEEAELLFLKEALLASIDDKDKEIEKLNMQIKELDKDIEAGMVEVKRRKEQNSMMEQIKVQKCKVINTLSADLAESKMNFDKQTAEYDQKLKDGEKKHKKLIAALEKYSINEKYKSVEARLKLAQFREKELEAQIQRRKAWNKYHENLQQKLYYAQFIEFARFCLDHWKKCSKNEELLQRGKQLDRELAEWNGKINELNKRLKERDSEKAATFSQKDNFMATPKSVDEAFDEDFDETRQEQDVAMSQNESCYIAYNKTFNSAGVSELANTKLGKTNANKRPTITQDEPEEIVKKPRIIDQKIIKPAAKTVEVASKQNKLHESNLYALKPQNVTIADALNEANYVQKEVVVNETKGYLAEELKKTITEQLFDRTLNESVPLNQRPKQIIENENKAADEIENIFQKENAKEQTEANKSAVKVSPYFKVPALPQIVTVQNNVNQHKAISDITPMDYVQALPIESSNISGMENSGYDATTGIFDERSEMVLSPCMSENMISQDTELDYHGVCSPMQMNYDGTASTQYSPPTTGFGFDFGQSGFGNLFGGPEKPTADTAGSFFSSFFKR